MPTYCDMPRPSLLPCWHLRAALCASTRLHTQTTAANEQTPKTNSITDRFTKIEIADQRRSNPRPQQAWCSPFRPLNACLLLLNPPPSPHPLTPPPTPQHHLPLHTAAANVACVCGCTCAQPPAALVHTASPCPPNHPPPLPPSPLTPIAPLKRRSPLLQCTIACGL